jgi:YD repeat-containing protein
MAFECDQDDRITAWIDRAGYRYEYEYDTAGRVVRASGEDGLMASGLSYDLDIRVTTVTDSLGHATEYHYDEHQHVCKTADPFGAITLTESDRHGRLLAHTNELGHTTRYTLDARGDQIRVERPDQTIIEIEYDELRNPTRITGPDSATWQYTYDERGNLLASTDPAGATSTYEHNEHGAVTRVEDALGGTTMVTTDRAGLPIAVTDPLGATWRITRDSRGRIVAVTDPLEAVTRTVYDGEDRPLARTHPDGTSETWSYDVRGNEISHTDQAGYTSETAHGPFNLITGRTDAVGARYEFAYDNQLRLTKVTNPQNLSWTYVYGATGKLASETDFNGRTLTYDHNAAGLLVRRVNGAGEGIELTRDALGRVVELRADDGQSATFGYDPAGRLTSAENADARLVFTRDARGRVLAESINGHTVSSTFDATGRRLTRTTPSGRQSAWKYDLAGRPLTLATDTEELFFGHDAAGRETYRWIGRRTAISNEWDELGRLTARRVLGVDPDNAESSRLVHERAWAYRADGVPESITDSSEGPRQLALDPAGRVTTVSAATWSEQYAYDLAGNVNFTADTRTPDAASTGPREVTGTLLRRAGRTNYEYDGQGRLIRRVQRTLSGNQKAWTYAYDARDRLTEATNPSGERWRYHYDPLGRRIAKQHLAEDRTPLEETRFAWDGTTVAEQVHSRGTGVEVATAWDYEPDSWTPVTQDRRSYLADAPQELVDRQFHAIVTDLVGTPTELLTVDGAVVWHRAASLTGGTLPKASPEQEAATCPLRFPGQYHDTETGLDCEVGRRRGVSG